jgi:hypothetical protein
MSFPSPDNTNPLIPNADTYTGDAIPNPETPFATQQIVGHAHDPADDEVNPEIPYAKTYTGDAIPNPEIPAAAYTPPRPEPD